MFIVTGATGLLGRGIVEALLRRVPADQVGVSVRDPGAASALADRGVRVRRGDFDDAASLRDAFEGAARVLLVSSNSGGPRTVEQHRTAIDAALAAGADRVLYTSHTGASTSSPFPPMATHAGTEEALAASASAFTSLRNGFYASTALRLLEEALETGDLRAPEDGPVSWTAHADLAEAGAIALAEPGRLDGVTAPLTAGEALDLAGVARVASAVTGRTITRTVVSDRDAVDAMVARGTPEAQAGFLLTMFEASRRGEFARVDPALGGLLGRPPLTIEDLLRERLGG